MKKILLILFFFQISIHLSANYPEIKTLHKSDSIYSQLQYEINEYYKRFQSGKPLIPLNIYSYKIKQNDSIFLISSKLNISYDTIVSLNGIENPDAINTGDILLIPNSPGVFVNKKPTGKLEELISLRTDRGKDIYINKSENLIPYSFISGSLLNSTERSFFLKTLFRKPLENIYITSGYGYRMHPFDGTRQFHTGIDYRASIGTSVYSSRDGIVSDTGVLGNYGLYIIIKHDGGYETVYSHLDKLTVKVNDRIFSGQIIAESGNSGISTGPHLHFEIRKKGIPLNPYDFFPGDN